MNRNQKSRHPLSLEAEQSLIDAAQGGSKRAVEILVALELPFIRTLSKRIARYVIHRPDVDSDVEDMVSTGVAELLRKIPGYNKERSNGARLRSYAFMDMKRAMNRTACDSLEAVRLPRESRIHRAHRDLENGMSIDELREKHPDVPDDALRSLHRTTVSIEQMREDEEIGQEVEVQLEPLLAKLWDRLDAMQREVITAHRLDLSPRERAKRLGVRYRDLPDMEASCFEQIRKLVQETQDADVNPMECGFTMRVWNRLDDHERTVLTCLWLLVNRSIAHRADFLGVDPARVRAIERTVIHRVRAMCC